jgi:hypothetical protein
LNFSFRREFALTLTDFGQTWEARKYVADLKESNLVQAYYLVSFNCLILENRMDKLDSLAAEWEKDVNEMLSEKDKQELRSVKKAVASFYQRDYTALLGPWRTRDDAPLDARSTFDSAMAYRLSGDSIRSKALFLRAKGSYEWVAAKTAGSLELMKINQEYAITLAALGEPEWEKVIAKSKLELVPRSTVIFLVAGKRKEAMRLLTKWKDQNIPLTSDGFIKPFWPLLKNNPLLDPLRSELGFEELWDGNHLKLKPLQVPVD